MPIIVRELVIRAKVEDVEADGASCGRRNRRSRENGLQRADIEHIVALCVEKALAAMKRERER